MGIVEHGLWEGRIDEISINEISQMDEDNSFPSTKFGPDRDEIAIAEISFTVAVASKKGHSVRCEMIERVGDFGQGGLRVEEGREGGEIAVGGRVLLLERGAVLVAVTGEFGRFGGILFDARSRSGDGENGRFDPEAG